MSREDIIAKLKTTEGALRSLGVGGLFLFGSHARGEGGADSDVDVFVDPVPGRSFGLVPYMDAHEAIETALGQPVDYGTRNGLHPGLRTTIEREAIRIF